MADQPVKISNSVAIAGPDPKYDVLAYAGADPTGATSSAAAVTAAWAAMKAAASYLAGGANSQYTTYAGELWFPPGIYDLRTLTALDPGAGNTLNFTISGAGFGHTTIVLGTGNYLVDVNATATVLSMCLRDLLIVGGGGAVRFNNTGSSVFNHYHFLRNIFVGYTVCALAGNSTDQPYWRVRDNKFDGISATSIGVALPQGGQHVVDGNSFIRDRYHIKMQGASNYIGKNDFIRTDAYVATARTDVWIIPDTNPNVSTQGTEIAANKFGNENLNAADFHILVAEENAGSGTDWGSRSHSTTTSTKDSVGCLVHHNDFIGAGAVPSIPVIYSTADRVYSWSVNYNTFYGTQPSYIIQFLNGTAIDGSTPLNTFGPNMCVDPGVNTVPIPMTNATGGGVGNVFDVTGQFQADPTAYSAFPGMNAGGEYVSMAVPAISAFTVGANSQVATTDILGRPNAATITFVANGDISGALSNITIGKTGYIEVDLKSGGATPLTSVKVEIRDTGNVVYFRAFIPLTSYWRTHRFSWSARGNGAGIALHLINPTAGAGTCLFGRPNAYHGREPFTNQHPQGLDVQGQWTGAGFTGEVVFGLAGVSGAYGFGTLDTTAPTMYFDHRGASNSGSWVWRNNGGVTARLTLDGTGKLTTGGALVIGTRPAFAASDKYLIVDASGNVHVSGLGPAS